MLFKKDLFAAAEKLIQARRLKIYRNKIEELKKMSNTRITYHVKNKFLEDNIERNFLYLQNGRAHNAEFMKLQDEIRKVENQIRYNQSKKLIKSPIKLDNKNE